MRAERTNGGAEKRRRRGRADDGRTAVAEVADRGSRGRRKVLLIGLWVEPNNDNNLFDKRGVSNDTEGSAAEPRFIRTRAVRRFIDYTSTLLGSLERAHTFTYKTRSGELCFIASVPHHRGGSDIH